MPVRAASSAVDAANVSQSERDEARGRQLRLQEERLGQLDREYRRQAVACEQGDEAACARRDTTWREIQTLTPNQTYRSE